MVHVGGEGRYAQLAGRGTPGRMLAIIYEERSRGLQGTEAPTAAVKGKASSMVQCSV